MDRNALREFLDRENFDPRSSSTDSPNPDEQYCQQQTSDGWAVYYAGRGLRLGEKVYDTEAEACSDFLERVLKDSTTRRRS